MKLEERTLRLISVGAAVAANCQPCLAICVANAKECGATQEEIEEAITVAKMVRRGAASKMDHFAAQLCRGEDAVTAPEGRCGCGT